MTVYPEQLFSRGSLRVGDEGPAQQTYTIKCSACEHVDSIISSKPSGGLPVDAIKKKFGQRGWEVSRNARRHLCPDCTQKKPNLKIVKESPVANNTVVAVAVEPPAMQREDRRIILAKLQDVYLDEEQGYSSGWSDQRVAGDLGVPLAWVEALRDENFGPLPASGSDSKAVEEAYAHLEDARKLQEEINGAVQRVEDALIELRSARAALDMLQPRLETQTAERERLAAQLKGIAVVLGKA